MNSASSSKHPEVDGKQELGEDTKAFLSYLFICNTITGREQPKIVPISNFSTWVQAAFPLHNDLRDAAPAGIATLIMGRQK